MLYPGWFYSLIVGADYKSRILHEILPENYLHLIFQLVTICLRLLPKHRLGVLTLMTVGNISSGRTLPGCVHWLCYQGLAVWEYSFALAALPMNPSVAWKIRAYPATTVRWLTGIWMPRLKNTVPERPPVTIFLGCWCSTYSPRGFARGDATASFSPAGKRWSHDYSWFTV